MDWPITAPLLGLSIPIYCEYAIPLKCQPNIVTTGPAA